MSETANLPQKLDDVMMAMDVVDTLRHRALIVEKELGSDAREEAMLNRLREIYAGQGIEVPDHILRDGVKALEENRFVYEPPKSSFALKLARVYVARDRWLRPLIIVFGLAILAVAIYRFGIVGPANFAFETAYSDLKSAYTKAIPLAQTPFALNRVEAIGLDGNKAAQALNRKKLSASVMQLEQIIEDLERTLTIRIVSRPGELSGVFRVPDNNPAARNYYVIVEALDGGGRPVMVSIESEEDQKTARVAKWGVRVSEAVFDGVKADKSDDQIIQNAVIGTKPKGALRPVYSIDTRGGTILDW